MDIDHSIRGRVHRASRVPTPGAGPPARDADGPRESAGAARGPALAGHGVRHGMPVPPGERRGVMHHQLDVLEVLEEASVAAYQEAARADVAAIRRRGRVPILVGGSGLYVRAVLDRLEIPPTDPDLRGRLEARAADEGADVMYRLLLQRDPAAAAQIQPANVRRIVRALEVIELTGRPFSASMPRREFVAPTVIVGLSVDRTVLDRRIQDRTEQMWRAGLRTEVEGLLPLGLRDGFTASRAIGRDRGRGYRRRRSEARDRSSHARADARSLRREPGRIRRGAARRGWP